MSWDGLIFFFFFFLADALWVECVHGSFATRMRCNITRILGLVAQFSFPYQKSESHLLMQHILDSRFESVRLDINLMPVSHWSFCSKFYHITAFAVSLIIIQDLYLIDRPFTAFEDGSV